jgi:lipopolysaccharide/colanic/teichoic acid biosynthesis glycosyltransferase
MSSVRGLSPRQERIGRPDGAALEAGSSTPEAVPLAAVAGGLGAGPAHALRSSSLRATKRASDIVVSAGLLVLLLPVIGAIAMLVRIDSPGPVFFRCDRVGYRGRSLRMLKFRKMVVDAAGSPLTVADDERFTRVGRWLTTYKLDELPQLWQVLTGEMSLVGPRPESPEFVVRHAADYRDRILTVRPGIFGLSQIAFARENAILDEQDPIAHYVERILPQKVRLDRTYAERVTPWLDVKVLFWAAVTVALRRPVAVHRDSVRMRLRRRERDADQLEGRSRRRWHGDQR